MTSRQTRCIESFKHCCTERNSCISFFVQRFSPLRLSTGTLKEISRKETLRLFIASRPHQSRPICSSNLNPQSSLLHNRVYRDLQKPLYRTKEQQTRSCAVVWYKHGWQNKKKEPLGLSRAYSRQGTLCRSDPARLVMLGCCNLRCYRWATTPICGYNMGPTKAQYEPWYESESSTHRTIRSGLAT